MSKLVIVYREDIVTRYSLSATHNTTIILFAICRQHKMSKLVIVYCEEIAIRYPSSSTHNTTIIPFVDSTK